MFEVLIYSVHGWGLSAFVEPGITPFLVFCNVVSLSAYQHYLSDFFYYY